MKTFHPAELPDLVVIDPIVHIDSRGFLLESWHSFRYRDAGIPGQFVQDVHSRSARGVLRGLHFQHPHDQGKLVRVSRGHVFDVSVDLRLGSKTFGKWWGTELSDTNHRQIWIPAGFAHGYQTLSERADFEYRCDALYSPDTSWTLAWDDPAVRVPWPIPNPVLSDSDSNGLSLSELERRGLLPEFQN